MGQGAKLQVKKGVRETQAEFTRRASCGLGRFEWRSMHNN